MKLTVFFLRAAFLILFIAYASIKIKACGPFNDYIPEPDYFECSVQPRNDRKSDVEQNLLLWQKLTSEDIPLEHIRKAVYKDSRNAFWKVCSQFKNNDGNRFYSYLINSNDQEIVDLLFLAKDLEECRANMSSPWYYPEKRDWSDYEFGDFREIIETCHKYKGTRLKDRYGLQMVRALFASRAYSRCIEYYDSAFAKIPNDNLFKQMSLSYIAGCWEHLGDKSKIEEYYADIPDIYFVEYGQVNDFSIERFPDSPKVFEYIQNCRNDSAAFCALKVVAENVLKGNRVKNRGDWEFLLAYMAGHYHSDYKTAAKHIKRALKQRFSSDEFRNNAKAYRVKIDAENGDMTLLYSDLLWFSEMIKLNNPYLSEKYDIFKNITYLNWVPALWNKKDYATAILLCSYVDNILPSKQRHQERYYAFISYSLDEIRQSETIFNEFDYGCLSFQLMGSLTSSQLINVKQKIKMNNQLYSLLKRYARCDAPYYNELIGTLALREENYKRAVQYLKLVPEKYQKTMNIFKEGYLARDPFFIEPLQKRLSTSINAKYEFAKKMLQYQKLMKNGKTTDERGLAKVKYAIARRNSFEGCWALTQYWQGGPFCLVHPYFDFYCSEDSFVNFYNILYKYDEIDSAKTKKIFESEISEAMASMTDEGKAQAECLLYNLKTVIKKYGNTETAKRIKASCDNWKQWI